MPRGKYTNHKGRNRRFTNPEELEQERLKEEQLKAWKKQHGGESSSEEEEDVDQAKGDRDSDATNSDEETSSDDEPGKAKGVSNLIDVENPNRVQKKNKKIATLDTQQAAAAAPPLTRKEREGLEKQRAQAYYQKLHAEGKTEQARADLARLAIVKQQREEAKKRRDIEIKEKEDAAKQKSAQTQKALGKK